MSYVVEMHGDVSCQISRLFLQKCKFPLIVDLCCFNFSLEKSSEAFTEGVNYCLVLKFELGMDFSFRTIVKKVVVTIDNSSN